MTTYALPAAIASKAIGFDIQIRGNVHANASPMNGVTRTQEFPGDLWMVRIEWPGMYHAEFEAHRAFWSRLRGMAHRVLLWPLINSGVPRGTMRGSPTLSSPASAGANTVIVTGIGTLLAGDFIGILLANGTVQLCCIAAATGTHTVTCELVSPLRRDAAVGAAVVWDRPTVEMILTAPPFPSYRMVVSEGYTIEAIEVVT